MRKLGLFSYLCLTATTAGADAPRVPADYLRSHAETKGFMLGRPVKARPAPDGASVIFLRSGARSPELSLYELDVNSGAVRELLTPQQILKGIEEQISPEEHARRERMRVSLRGFTSFDLSQDGSQILLSLSGQLYLYRRKDGAITKLRTGPTPVIDAQLSPDGRSVAYVRDRDVFVLDLAGQSERRLTESRDPRISYGLAEFVAQEEMHRFSGLFWSPDSQHIAYEEVDNRGVEELFITDPAHPERPPARAFYPRPGKANAVVRVAVIPRSGGRPTWVRWDRERFPYLATVRWQEGGPLTLVVMSRDQHDLEVLCWRGKGSATERLLAEHDDLWLNLDQEMPHWLPSGAGFLWTSERSGRRQLSLHDRAGRHERVLVDGRAGYRGFLDLDETKRRVYYLASPEPSQNHIHSVGLDGGDATALTSAPGVYQASFSKNHLMYVQTAVSLGKMPVTSAHRSDGRALGLLPSVAEEPPLTPRVEITEAGALGMRAAILRPRAFQQGRKYPVVVHVYGGPSHLQVNAAMPGYLLDQFLAEHGYIVVTMDGRGTPGRGREWERAIAGSFARVPLQDQIGALRDLARRNPEMDIDRVGIYGWSFGGYMAALAVMLEPSLFKVGVAGAPVTEWRDYDTFYTERYLGLPRDNPAGYDESSLLHHAAKLSRPLLLIHGTADDNVYFSHTLKLSWALFHAGRHHEVLPLSGLTHMVPDPMVLERLWGRILAMLGSVLRP